MARTHPKPDGVLCFIISSASIRVYRHVHLLGFIDYFRETDIMK